MLRKRLWPRFALATLIAAALPLAVLTAAAQASKPAAAQASPAAAAATGQIHGQVIDPTGAPVGGGGTVSMYLNGLASATSTPKYELSVDADGSFKGDKIAVGSYTLTYRAANTPKGQVVDQIDGVKVVAGQDTAQNFDMTRAEYMSKLTPEERKTIEETKKKNEGILKENAQIKNLNADLAKARQDDRSQNFQDAAALMQKDVAVKPDAAVLWVELGMAQRGLKQWADASTSLQKGIELDAASKKPNPGLEGAANDALGECLAAQGKIPESQAAYDAAAKINPPGAGMYYQNETIVMARSGQTDATVAAADKAIAADPNRPIPYYLKGQALVSKATMDPKTQRIVAPPGCQEAYQKYLQLDPNGQFSGDAKQILAQLTSSQPTSYKAKKH